MDETEKAAYEQAVINTMEEWDPPASTDRRKDILRSMCEPDFLNMWNAGKQYGMKHPEESGI
jgi:hypothetical protein